MCVGRGVGILSHDIFTKPEVSFSPASLQLGLNPGKIKKSILMNSLEPGNLPALPRAKHVAPAGHGNPTEGLAAQSSMEMCQGLSPLAAPSVLTGTCVCDRDHRLFFGIHIS